MATVLVGFVVLGALGLFLALPGGRAELARVGLVFTTAAGGALLATGLHVVTRDTSFAWFVGSALVAIFAAVRVITHRRPVYSALYFVLLVVAVASLLVLMQAQFLSVALLIIYAGAILVTYVFVIMLAQQARPAPYDTRSREPLLGCLAGFLLLTIIAAEFDVLVPPSERTALPAVLGDTAGTVDAIGTRLFTQYVVAIQIIGLLLLAAMVGAIAIARRQPTGGPDLEGED